VDHNCHKKLEKPLKKQTNNVILYNKTFNTIQEKNKTANKLQEMEFLNGIFS